jgi:hypothetical protein
MALVLALDIIVFNVTADAAFALSAALLCSALSGPWPMRQPTRTNYRAHAISD